MQSAPFELSPSQKIQVTLLYLYASFDYLKELRLKLQALMVAVDPTLELSKMQRRNSLIPLPSVAHVRCPKIGAMMPAPFLCISNVQSKDR